MKGHYFTDHRYQKFIEFKNRKKCAGDDLGAMNELSICIISNSKKLQRSMNIK